MRSVIGYAAFLVVSTVALLELSIRVWQLAPPLTERPNWVPDARIPYKYRPLSVRSQPPERGESPVDYRHNSLGFRDEEHVQEKPPGTFRIVALGDSFTYGVGVEFADTYLVRLERLLNTRPGSRVEIIKLGIPAIHTHAKASKVSSRSASPPRNRSR
jgi:hypothetical protein